MIQVGSIETTFDHSSKEELPERPDGILPAAWTLVHRLQNDVTLVLALLDSLQLQPDLPAACREEIQEAVSAVEATARHVREFQRALGEVPQPRSGSR